MTEIIQNYQNIQGLYYIENYLSTEECTVIQQQINSLTFEPISDAKNSRRVAHFGYRYAYDRSGLKPAPAIPNWLDELFDPNLPITTSKINQIIINEYKPNQQIAYHTDHHLFGPVIAVLPLVNLFLFTLKKMM